MAGDPVESQEQQVFSMDRSLESMVIDLDKKDLNNSSQSVTIDTHKLNGSEPLASLTDRTLISGTSVSTPRGENLDTTCYTPRGGRSLGSSTRYPSFQDLDMANYKPSKEKEVCFGPFASCASCAS